MSRTTPPQIFSRPRRIAAFDRALRRQAAEDAARFVLDEMVEDVLDRLAFMRFEPASALVIGDLTGRLGEALRVPGASVSEADVRSLDEEAPLPGGPYDLVVSLASIAQVNDLPGALLHARGGLRTGGIFLASVIGAGSLAHLRRAMIAAEPERTAARLHPLIDTQSASALMQRAGFRRQVVDSHAIDVAYRSLGRLVGDLRDQGLGNVLRDNAPPLDRTAARRAAAAFLQDADHEGQVIETFEILTLTGWKD